MDGKYEFVSPEWDEISDKAKDMVRLADGTTQLALSVLIKQIEEFTFTVLGEM